MFNSVKNGCFTQNQNGVEIQILLENQQIFDKNQLFVSLIW